MPADTAARARRVVAAVAATYLAEVNTHTSAGREQQSVVLRPAAVIPGIFWFPAILATGAAALCGALIGAFAGLVSSRTPRPCGSLNPARTAQIRPLETCRRR